MGIIIDHNKCILCNNCLTKCPFGALELKDGKVEVNAACKMCRLCLKNCPVEAITEEKATMKPSLNKDEWRDILVYVEHDGKSIHPITYELIGKALELAKVIDEKVICLMIGDKIKDLAYELLEYGVSQVDVYDRKELKYFRADLYKDVFVDCIKRRKPNTVLVGATVSGRSLAPRVAAYFKTGLTADCTVLKMREDTDLVQIRPAFGGNIMAQILTTANRPQFATVRYKVMDQAKRVKPFGKVEIIDQKGSDLTSKIEILKVEEKPTSESIEDAEVLVAIGRGIKDEKTITKIEKIAELLHGKIACSRPLVEDGRYSVYRQIGLSGRSVKPKLIITFGISGAIQFTAGMKDSEMIIAINTDPEAAIFDIAHVAIVADGNIIADKLLRYLEENKNA